MNNWSRIIATLACLLGVFSLTGGAIAQPCDAGSAFCPPGTTCLVATNSTELLAHFATAAANAPNPYRIYVCCEGTPYTFTLAQLQAPGSAVLVDNGANVELIGWCQGAEADPGEVTIQGPGPEISCDPAQNTDIVPVEDANLFRLFRVNDGRLKMTDLTLRRGAAWFSIPSTAPVSAGGAVNVSTNGAFEATSCIFEENLAASDGGAVFVEQGGLGDLKLDLCTFLRNTALRQGGGVFTQRTANVFGGSFDCNFAGRPDNLGGAPYETDAFGGAFYSDDANVTIQRQTSPALGPVTTFTSNRAHHGGAMSFTATAERRVYEATFFGNRARASGGALFAQNAANLALGFLTFGGPNAGEGNFAEEAGGACYFQNFNKSQQPQVLGCRFEGNSTNGSGGAVAHDTAVPGKYDHCFFRSNSAVENGGAVDVRGTSRPEFNDCVFVQNSAGTGGVAGDGGALSLISSRATTGTDADCRFYNCSFSRNTVNGPSGGATARGGTVYIEDSAPIFLHCTIAYEGTGQAGVYAIPPGSLPANFPRPRFINSVVYRACRPGAQTCPQVFAAGPFAFAISNNDFTYLDVRYSDIRVASLASFGATNGNIDCDPLFVMSLGGADSEDNVHLQPCSPCIDRALYSLTEERFTPPGGVFSDWPRPGDPPNPPSDAGSEDIDYDDLASSLAGFVEDVFEIDLLGTRPVLFSFTDVLPDQRVTTPRPLFCQADMGADEATTSITASLTVVCQARGTDTSSADTCDVIGTPVDNPSCGYCVGDDVFISPNLTATCPGEFEITWYHRNSSNPTPCPPTTVPGIGDVELPSASFPNIQVTDGNRLCINDATANNTGCYYAVARRVSCGQDLPTDFVLLGNCPEELAACTCITIGSPPTITGQPQPAAVCDGTPVVIGVTAVGTGGPLCYQWFRRDTACTGPGSGGTPINGATSASISFLPARARCPGEPADAQDDNGYYYVVVSYCNGGSGGNCVAITSDCAHLTVFCPPAITGGGSATVCGGGAAGTGGVQDCCYTVTAPAGCVPVITWYKDIGQPGSEGDDIVVSTGSPTGVTISTTPLGNDQYQTCIIWDLEGLSAAQAQALAGNYYIKAYCADPNCTTRSGNCSLIVRPQPVVTVNPQDAATCEGSPQCFDSTVTYSGTTPLCWEWRRKATCATAGDGDVVSSGTWVQGQPLTFEHCIVSAQAGDEQCYFFRIRVCSPDDLDKCPWVTSGCGCLEVRPQLTACELLCDSGMTDAEGNCLYCPGSQILLCCNITSPDGPLCYQWQKQTVAQIGAWEDIPGQTAQCLEIRSFDPVSDATCYRVRVNYSDLSGPNCPETSDKCDAVYSNPICLAPTQECCEIECPCKDNSSDVQDVYSLWHTGEWDEVNGEWSFDRTTTDGVVIKSADDFFLDPYSMHHITTFTGKMLVKQSNPSLELHARLRIYKDCNGRPGELIDEFDSECAAFIQSAPDGFNLYQFQFFFDCLWLEGGAYWASLVAVAPTFDDAFEAFWASTGELGNPPIPTVMGMRPLFMDGLNDWQEFDPCCHPCTDLQFCIIGESCPIVWDNGKPYLAGADDQPPGNPPFDVFGTRSEKSTLTARNSRAADQFVIKTCDTEDVCYLEGYIFTNCVGFEAHLEIYENDCREPDFVLPGGTPYYTRIADNVVDLGYSGLRVGTTNVRAYRVSFCDWPEPLTFAAGKNYWVSLSIRDSFSSAERAFFAHVEPPCEPCTSGNIWKINPGMEIAPGRQIPDWQSVGADFAFLIATRKHPGRGGPDGDGPRSETCMADVNNNDITDVADIFLFLSAWFTGCP